MERREYVTAGEVRWRLSSNTNRLFLVIVAFLAGCSTMRADVEIHAPSQRVWAAPEAKGEPAAAPGLAARMQAPPVDQKTRAEVKQERDLTATRRLPYRLAGMHRGHAPQTIGGTVLLVILLFGLGKLCGSTEGTSSLSAEKPADQKKADPCGNSPHTDPPQAPS
jgi:hypothetical protein